MPSEEIAKLVEQASANVRGSAAPRVLLARLQTCLSFLQGAESNDTMTLVQAAAICQVLAEYAAINNDSINPAL